MLGSQGNWQPKDRFHGPWDDRGEAVWPGSVWIIEKEEHVVRRDIPESKGSGRSQHGRQSVPRLETIRYGWGFLFLLGLHISGGGEYVSCCEHTRRFFFFLLLGSLFVYIIHGETRLLPAHSSRPIGASNEAHMMAPLACQRDPASVQLHGHRSKFEILPRQRAARLVHWP